MVGEGTSPLGLCCFVVAGFPAVQYPLKFSASEY